MVIGRRVPSAAVDMVRAADDRGVAQAVGHLAGLGHRDIAFVDGGSGTIAADRRRGYRQAMRGGASPATCGSSRAITPRRRACSPPRC